MNCPECDNLLQQEMDGEGIDCAAIADHLADCGRCRAAHRAAKALARGLRLLVPPAPSADLTERLTRIVLADRRARLAFRRRTLIGSALAAGIAVAVFTGLSWRANPPTPGPGPIVHQPSPGPTPEDVPSLRESVVKAGTAVALLAGRAADETVGQGRYLVPPMPAPTFEDVSPMSLDAPARTLAEAGQGVSEGLAPVADSARRAVGLLLRLSPGVGEPGA